MKNSSSPISRLPPETLVEIFMHGTRDYYYSTYGHAGSLPCWVNVSYVCRHWRDVALNCPTLWAYPFNLSLRWTEELLARSKRASLKIRISFSSLRPDSWWSEHVEKLLSHLERIEELYLHVPGRMLPTISLSAPRLQILDLSTSQSPFQCAISDRDVRALRVLKLTDCALQWHLLNLGRLTTFFLSYIPISSKKSVAELLVTLRCMPALTVLHLEYALAGARGFLSGGTLDAFSKINLPCLARLLLAAPLSTVVAFLFCVNIPSKTEVRLDFDVENGSSFDDYAQIPSVLAQSFSDMSSFNTNIHINFPLISRFALCASEHACDFDCYASIGNPQWDCSIPLFIIVRMDSSMTTCDKISVATEICRSISLTDVQTLCVVNPPFSSDIWRKILGRFHDIRHLILHDGVMPDLIPFLTLAADGPVESQRPGGPVPTPGHHCFVPALEELTLSCIAFSLRDDLSRSAISQKSLLDALSTRRELHPQVTMVDCDVYDDVSDIASDSGDSPFYMNSPDE